MGMSAGLIWPEALDEEDDDHGDPDQPGFSSPDDMAQWLMALMDDDSEADLRALGCAALLAYYTEGMESDAVQWTSPAELSAAAERLAGIVRMGGSTAAQLLDTYVDYSQTGKPVDTMLLEELEAVRNMARWAEQHGKTPAFEINW